MLWKLLKHEMSAMGRVMLPIWGALLILSVFVSLTDLLLGQIEGVIAGLATGMLFALFVTGCMAASVVAVIMMILRFQKSVLSREGYLTHTLPVNVHQLVWSRVLTASIYMAATMLVIGGCFLIAIARTGMVREMLDVFVMMWQDIITNAPLHGVLYMVEFILMIVVAELASCLMFYAALSIGHSFANHKILLSVVFYFVLYTGTQIVSMILMIIIVAVNIPELVMHMDTAEQMFRYTHTIMLSGGLLYLIYCTVYYLLTTGMLKRRLNLQ